jgi:hypothetical protein
MVASFLIGQGAGRRGRLRSPDPSQQTDEDERRGDEHQAAAHFTRMRIHEHIADVRNVEGHTADLAVQPDRPGVATRIGVPLCAVRRSLGRLDDADDAMRDEAALDVRVGKGDHVSDADVLGVDRPVDRESADGDRGLHGT